MKHIILFGAAFLVACNQASGGRSDDWSTDPRLVPVIEKDAPTFGALRAKDYVIVDFVGTGFECGDDCVGHAFESVFLGKEPGPNKKGVIEFACPGTEKDINEWRCRSLPETPSDG